MDVALVLLLVWWSFFVYPRLPRPLNAYLVFLAGCTVGVVAGAPLMLAAR